MNNSNIWWTPWKCGLQRKWQQWSRTWNMNISKQFKNVHWTQIITNQTSFVNISQNLNEGKIPTSFVRQRGRPWWKPEREHSCKWDCDSRRKKSIVITLVSSHIYQSLWNVLKLIWHWQYISTQTQIFQRSYLVKTVKKRFLSEMQQPDSIYSTYIPYIFHIYSIYIPYRYHIYSIYSIICIPYIFHLVKTVKKRFLSEMQQPDSSISGSAETLSMRAFSSIST